MINLASRLFYSTIYYHANMTEGERVNLKALIGQIDGLNISGSLDKEITGLTQDSRQVAPGNLFFCVRGARFDGHLFLKDVAERGAVAVVVEEMPPENYGMTLIQTTKTTEVIRPIASKFYDHPEKKLQLIGVVGTNGKTTSTYLMKNVLETAGHRVGLIGTIANIIHNKVIPSHNTTPGMLELIQLFAEMVAEGVEYVVMEVSSHSIDQGRVAGLAFRYGIFTNITQDHLDYHGTFEEYLRVKTKFFVNLPSSSWATLNADDEHCEYVMECTSARVLTYALKNEAHVRAEKVVLTLEGTAFTAVTPLASVDIRLQMAGECNVYNSLGVLATAMTMGIDLQTIKTGLESMSGVPGRFERIPGTIGYQVLVDYAHTPDGLANVLRSGRKLGPRRMVVVFGCGGDRDRTKRPMMGEIAADLADYIILTSDNPRSEEPVQIIREIESGILRSKPDARYQVEPDRAAAICQAIMMAQTGDLIWIVGKGHEDYQEIAGRKIHFDDREVARAALAEREALIIKKQ